MDVDFIVEVLGKSGCFAFVLNFVLIDGTFFLYEGNALD